MPLATSASSAADGVVGRNITDDALDGDDNVVHVGLENGNRFFVNEPSPFVLHKILSRQWRLVIDRSPSESPKRGTIPKLSPDSLRGRFAMFADNRQDLATGQRNQPLLHDFIIPLRSAS